MCFTLSIEKINMSWFGDVIQQISQACVDSYYLQNLSFCQILLSHFSYLKAYIGYILQSFPWILTALAEVSDINQ